MQKVQLPHYLTVLAFISTFFNLVCGLLGIYFSMAGDLELALRLLIVGAFFDVLDGRFARRAPTQSELGVYADSFADLFTFALLPAYMAINASLYLRYQVVFSDITVIIILAAFYSFSGWYRLVRFSVKPTGVMFQGLPSSAAAMFLGALIVLNEQFLEIEFLSIVTTLGLVFSGIMMISKISYPSPKRMWRTDNYLFAIASLMGIIYIFIPNLISLLIILAIFMIYIFFGPLYYKKSEELIAAKR